MATYLFRCDKCGNEHEIELKMEDIGKTQSISCRFPVTVDKTGEIVECNGELRRVYTPFQLRIK